MGVTTLSQAATMTQTAFDNQALARDIDIICKALGGTKSEMTASEYCDAQKAAKESPCEDSVCSKVTQGSTIPPCCSSCEKNMGKDCDKTDSTLISTYCKSVLMCKTTDCQSAAASIVPSMALLAVAAVAAAMFF